MKLSVLVCLVGLCVLAHGQFPNPTVLVPGWTVQPWITAGGARADDVAMVFGTGWDETSNLYIVDVVKHCILKYAPSALPVNTVGGAAHDFTWRVCSGGDLAIASSLSPFGLVVKNNRVYFSTNPGPSVIYEISLTTGQIIRNVLTMPSGSIAIDMHVDPISGDVFVTTFNGMYRIHDIETNSAYATAYGTDRGFFDGFSFGPDGTIYAVQYSNQQVYRIDGSTVANPATTIFISDRSFLPMPDGNAICAGEQGTKLIVDSNNGHIISKHVTTGAQARIAEGFGGKLDLANVGPDNALFVTQQSNSNILLWRLYNPDCKFVVTPPVEPSGPCPDCATKVHVGTSCTSTSKHSSSKCVTLAFSDAVNTC